MVECLKSTSITQLCKLLGKQETDLVDMLENLKTKRATFNLLKMCGKVHWLTCLNKAGWQTSDWQEQEKH